MWPRLFHRLIQLTNRSTDSPNTLNQTDTTQHDMASSSATRRRLPVRGGGGGLPLLPLLLLLVLVQQGAHAALWGGGSSTSTEAAPSALALSTHVEPVHLDWEDIDCVLTLKDGRRKHLLNGVSARGLKGGKGGVEVPNEGLVD